MEYEKIEVFTAVNTQQCPACKAYFTKAALFCPHCGKDLSEAGETAPLEQEKKAIACIIQKADQRRIPLNQHERFLIGTLRGTCDYVVSNSAVSRRHAEIIRKDDAYCIRDLKSSNHTYINGEKLVPEKEYPLKNGDTVVLGNEEFTFVIE